MYIRVMTFFRFISLGYQTMNFYIKLAKMTFISTNSTKTSRAHRKNCLYNIEPNLFI